MNVSRTVTEPPSAWGLAVRLLGVALLSTAASAVLLLAYQKGELLGGFYLVLGACFVGGLFTATRGFLCLMREGRRQKRLFAALDGKELWAVIDGWREDSLSRRVLLSLHTQQVKSKQDDGFVAADPFLAGMLIRLSSQSRQIKEAGLTCIALGVLGTMAGLAGMFDSLRLLAANGGLAAGDGGTPILSSLFHEGGPFALLGTAWATSLAGGAGKLVLWNLGTVIQRHAEHITAHLADAIARDIAPAIKGSRV